MRPDPPDVAAFQPREPIGLYIHVPFCTAKCDYCGFFSVPAPSRETVSAVLEATVRDAAEMLTRLGRPPVRSVYIGGGSPSILTPGELLRLGEGVARSCGQTQFEEWTVEANPDTITGPWVDALSDLPVTRVSVGVQSFSHSVRSEIGRRGGLPSTHAALELLRSRGRHALGIDLLAGCPAQSADRLLEDLGAALFYTPEHVSLYPLSLEPGTPLAERVHAGRARLASDGATVSAVERARRMLADAHIMRYELSNYAKPGYECRHNDTYWCLEPYLGVGPGAVSTLPAGDGTALRLESSTDVEMFLRAEDGLARRKSETVERRSFILEHFMMGLRRTAGVPASRMVERFGAAPRSFAPKAVERWEAAGLLEANGEDLSMTAGGTWFVDTFLREIAAELSGAG